MFCTRCGKQQRDNSAFCRHCGDRHPLPLPPARPVNRRTRRPAFIALVVCGSIAAVFLLSLVLVVLAMGAVPPTPPPPADNLRGIGQLYAVVVGVSDYQHDDGYPMTDLIGPD